MVDRVKLLPRLAHHLPRPHLSSTGHQSLNRVVIFILLFLFISLNLIDLEDILRFYRYYYYSYFGWILLSTSFSLVFHSAFFSMLMMHSLLLFFLWLLLISCCLFVSALVSVSNCSALHQLPVFSGSGFGYSVSAFCAMNKWSVNVALNLVCAQIEWKTCAPDMHFTSAIHLHWCLRFN